MAPARSVRRKAEFLISAIAAGVAIFMGVLPPSALYWAESKTLHATLEAEAQINARLIAQVINQNPDHWRLESLRLNALLAKRPVDKTPELRVVTDDQGQVVAESLDDIGTTTIHFSTPVYDSGVVVGQLTISRSLSSLVIRTGLVAVASFVMAFLTFLFLRWLPQRALIEALKEADEAKEQVFEVMRQKDKAQAAADMRSTFLATMSHEIRTPMNAILGMLNLLQITEQTQRQQDYTEKATVAAQSLLGIINDILDFSKIDAGKLELDSQPFSLDQLMRHLGVILSANLDKKPVELLFDIDPELPHWVRGDAMRIQQVLINLGGNAVKFTQQGQVVVALRLISRSTDAVRLEFSVQDTGIGIAREHQARIFDGFSQADASTTRRFGGTGLGLSISNRLVRLMGGDIGVSSTEGVGSRFSFVLVLPVAQALAVAEGQRTAPDLAGLRVLIVDDNRVAGDMMQRMVEPLKWRADVARSCTQAMQLIHAAQGEKPGEFPYPVVFVDWQMPEADGWETARQIHELAKVCSGVRPDVIMVTAHGRETLANRSAEELSLLSGFLVKPVTPSMMLDAVADTRAGASGLRQSPVERLQTRQLAGMRILVVEDNPINQQVADELLSAAGALVTLAANGLLGVEAVAHAAPQFDVVLMDIQMPVLDGYGATQRIRQELQLADLPIIAMTANAMASDRDACLAAGMNEHVGKPFDMAKLVSLLIRTVGFQPPLQSTVDAVPPPDCSPTRVVVPGLDLETALSRMAGMRSLYVRAARDFSGTLATVADELQDLHRSNDHKTLLMRLHTLKGNAATLGVSDLSSKVAELEGLYKAARDAGQCLAGLDELAQLLPIAQRRLAQAIAQMDVKPVAAPAQPQTAASSQALLHALQRLDALLLDCDLEALQCYATVREKFGDLSHPLAEALDSAMQNLDLESARGICSQMLAALESKA